MPLFGSALLSAALLWAAASLSAAELYVATTHGAFPGPEGRVLPVSDRWPDPPHPRGMSVRVWDAAGLGTAAIPDYFLGIQVLHVSLQKGYGAGTEDGFQLRKFCLTLKSDFPHIKLLVSGDPAVIRMAEIEWVADAVEGASIPSRALVVAQGPIGEWVASQGLAGTLLVRDPDPAQAALYWERLEAGVALDDLLEPEPAGVVPLVREDDLATLLLMPPSGSVTVRIPSAWYAGASRADGTALPLRRQGDGVTFAWPGSDRWEVVEMVRPPSGEGYFTEQQSVAGRKSYALDEVLARIQLELLRARRVLPAYSTRTNTVLRIKPGSTGQAVQVKIAGRSLFEDGLETHWAWEELEIEGRPWKGKGAPPLPILQPEVVKVRPFELRPRSEYQYHLHEGQVLGGRPALRVDYAPTAALLDQGRPAYQGSIWVAEGDFALLRLDRTQLNLTREVLESDESITFDRVRGVFLPRTVEGRENLSLLGDWTLVEMRVDYSAVEPAGDREALLARWMEASRQLLRREDKEWVRLKERKIPTFYLAAGLAQDPGYDAPLPLGGLAWFSLDPKNQYTAVFAGVLGFGNKTFYAGHAALTVDGFFLAIPFEDAPWRGGEEVEGETLKTRLARLGFRVLLPVTRALSLAAGVQGQYDRYERADATDPAFLPPASGLTTTGTVEAHWTWKGFSLVGSVEGFRRHGYEPWGWPDDLQTHDAGLRYGLTLGKDHYFSEAFRLHFDCAVLDGRDLDRFSYHSGSAMGASSIRGFASGAAVGEKLIVGHVSQSIVMRPYFNLTVGLDAGRFTAPEEKTLVGMGLSTLFFGPWETLIQAEAGVGLSGDGKDWALRLLLFKSL